MLSILEKMASPLSEPSALMVMLRFETLEETPSSGDLGPSSSLLHAQPELINANTAIVLINLNETIKF